MALENQVTFAEVGNPKRVTQLTENTDASGAYFLTEKVGESAAKKTSYATVEGAVKSKVQSEYLQTLSASPASDKTMSEKLVVGELKKRDDKIVQLEQGESIYNVTVKIPLASGSYYTAATARAAVPTSVRKVGLVITYQTSTTSWVTEQFFQGAISAWTTATNWKSFGAGGNITLTYTTDVATTRKLVPLADRKQGTMISYYNGTDLITEQFTNTVVSDATWTTSSNWILLAGAMTIGTVDRDLGIVQVNYDTTGTSASDRRGRTRMSVYNTGKLKVGTIIGYFDTDLDKYVQERYLNKTIANVASDSSWSYILTEKDVALQNASVRDDIGVIYTTYNTTGIDATDRRGKTRYALYDRKLVKKGVIISYFDTDKNSHIQEMFVLNTLSDIAKDTSWETIYDSTTVSKEHDGTIFKKGTPLQNKPLHKALISITPVGNRTSDDLYTLDGKFRQIRISYFGAYYSGGNWLASIYFLLENSDQSGFKEYRCPFVVENQTATTIKEVTSALSIVNFGFIKISVEINPSVFISCMFNTQGQDFYTMTQISDNIMKDVKNTTFHKSRSIASFYPADNLTHTSNYQYSQYKQGTLSTVCENGNIKYKVTNGYKLLYSQLLESVPEGASLFVKTSGTNCENIDYRTIECGSSMDNRQDSAILNRVNNQFVHPDLCYCSAPVGGYKYWMATSVYPYCYPATEDVELLVSNDAENWERIQHVDEVDNGKVALKLPKVGYACNSYGRQNTFVPAPNTGQTFSFCKQNNVISNNLLTAYLNHDPAIFYDNGSVYVLITYNLGLDNTPKKYEKYRVLLRTQDGNSWFVIRENGTEFALTEESSWRLFTADNGVRNHIFYMHDETGVDGKEVCPQIVKVSNNEWYLYVNQKNDGEGNIGIIRYRGSSVSTFDFSKYDDIKCTTPLKNRLWHTSACYINGAFYIVYFGHLLKSTDGINFTAFNSHFFHQCSLSDLYKPSLRLIEGGKIACVYGLQIYMAYPAAKIKTSYNETKLMNNRIVTQSVIAKYASIAEIERMSTDGYKDASIDIFVHNDSLDGNSGARFFFGLRNATTINSLYKGDSYYFAVTCIAENTGEVNFEGICLNCE